jgi:hypothetical protein
MADTYADCEVILKDALDEMINREMYPEALKLLEQCKDTFSGYSRYHSALSRHLGIPERQVFLVKGRLSFTQIIRKLTAADVRPDLPQNVRG